MEREQFAPSLRDKSSGYLSLATSWMNFILPEAQRINWYGDVQLYCTEDAYQEILTIGPKVRTVSVFRGEDAQRRISAEGQELDDYRVELRKWLTQFD